MKRIYKNLSMILCIILLILIMTGCTKDLPQEEPAHTINVTIPPMVITSDFAAYKEATVEATPQIAPYKVEPGLSNITNTEMFEFSEEAEKLLIENGFVVVPGDHREFFSLYEINSYEPVPSFITTDSMLHNYHLFFSHLLRVIEKDNLYEELKELTESMITESGNQYEALKSTEWENAALRNLGFFAVAGRLLNLNAIVPKEIKREVDQELSLIKSHEGIKISPLMSSGRDTDLLNVPMEDYSQYIPRGHYDDDETLRTYFKTMMWYGRITFRLKDEEETKSAALITLALGKDDNLKRWDRIYQPTCFFVGKSDDLSYPQYRDILENVYGSEFDLKELAENNDKWQDFLKRAAELEPPMINSIPIFDESIQPDRESEIKGFRFMGQRFTLDASIFQRLVYREVKENEEGNRRMLPKALDIPAAFGSEEAYSILKDLGETNYKGYPENMEKLQSHIKSANEETWTQNLYWSWLYTLKTLTGIKEEGYPSFMQNKAWQRKDLCTFLSSWTELKHDTILYTKQVYAEMGGGMPGVDDRGYVEPNPKLYARLAALINMTKEGLSSRQLIAEKDKESLDRMEYLALSLKTISEKELSDISLTDEEYDLIRSYGGQLQHFWLEALGDKGIDHRSASYDNPAALIADVATDPNGSVLQEATGLIYDIYAVVPIDGSLRIAKGGVYSYYEFQWPLNDRLTDKKWHEMLNAGETPPMADWTKSYIAQ